MKTSTKNIIVNGIFIVITAIITSVVKESNQEIIVHIDDKALSVNAKDYENLLREYNEIKDKYDKDLILENKDDKNKNLVTLDKLYVVDSYEYEITKGFSDSYGNSYSLAYEFDASKNAFAIFNLEQKYTTFTGYVTTSPKTNRNAKLNIEIYGDDKLLKKFESITKISENIFINDIDVTGVKKLKINTYNTGEFNYGFIYLTDINLS